MSVTSNYNLFSNTTAQALQRYLSNQTYTDALATINTKNLANNGSYGFDYSRIFSSASSSTDASIFTKGYATATDRALNSQKLYSASGNGASMIDCYYNSMNSVALGQDAPKSVFEQRLELMIGQEIQTSGTMLGDYSNYFSSSTSAASSSKANTAASTSTTTSTTAASSSGTKGETALSKYTGRAASAKSVSEMMGFLA